MAYPVTLAGAAFWPPDGMWSPLKILKPFTPACNLKTISWQGKTIPLLLCISTSERVLPVLFACRNHTYDRKRRKKPVLASYKWSRPANSMQSTSLLVTIHHTLVPNHCFGTYKCYPMIYKFMLAHALHEIRPRLIKRWASVYICLYIPSVIKVMLLPIMLTQYVLL